LPHAGRKINAPQQVCRNVRRDGKDAFSDRLAFQTALLPTSDRAAVDGVAV